jgi:hypothetical protein
MKIGYLWSAAGPVQFSTRVTGLVKQSREESKSGLKKRQMDVKGKLG